MENIPHSKIRSSKQPDGLIREYSSTIYRPGQIRCRLVTMSLCFLEAFQEKQKGNITEQEYIHHLFVHCQGVEHEGDDLMETDWDLLEAEALIG